MPIATRDAEVIWEGGLASGTGTVSSGSGVRGALPVTWASRTERADGKTSPEELIAGAHTSCFAMALSLMLGENHTPPDRLVVSAACTLDEVDGAPKVTRSEPSVRADSVPRPTSPLSAARLEHGAVARRRLREIGRGAGREAPSTRMARAMRIA